MWNLFTDIAPILIKACPIIASALGGPLSGLAVSVISYAFGTDAKQPQSLVNKIMEDVPGATTILQALEQQHGDFFNKLMSGMNNLATAEITIKLAWQLPNACANPVTSNA